MHRLLAACGFLLQQAGATVAVMLGLSHCSGFRFRAQALGHIGFNSCGAWV